MKVLTIILGIIAVVLIMAMPAPAHENDTWKHMSGSSGSLIGQRMCQGFTVWYHADEQGELDRCIGVRLIDDQLHVAPVELTMGKDYHDNPKPDCSCTLIEGIGQ